jgi:hypothetical protein
LGSQIGRYFKPVLAGLLAVLVSLLLYNWAESLSSGKPRFLPFGDTGASIQQIGSVFNLSHLLVGLAFLAVTGVLLLVAPVRNEAAKLRLTPLGAVFGVVVLAIVAVMPRFPITRFMSWDPANPQADRCINGTVRYCYFHEHERWAKPIIKSLDDMLAKATAAGFGDVLPKTINETANSEEDYIYDPQNVYIYGIDRDGLEYGPKWFLDMIYYPYSCPQTSSLTGPSDQFWEDKRAITDTIALAGGIDEVDLSIALDFQPLTPSEIQTILQRWTKCQLE